MTGRAAMIDGILSPLDRAMVSVLDRGFLYGDSVFETVRTYGGRPFALERHLVRLERSAELVHIRLPVPREVLEHEVLEAVRTTGNAESYVRVMVTRGMGELGLDPSATLRPMRLVIVTPLTPPSAEVYEHGISAVTYRARRAADATPAAGAKVGNYLVAVLAVERAHASGAAEAFIVDSEDRVVEGATSNVFFVRHGALLTPPEDAGILPGITRGIVLDVAKDLGIAVELRAPGLSELGDFDEIFVSSSIRELLAVIRVDGSVVGAGSPGAVYTRLLAAFRERAREIQRLEDTPSGPFTPTEPPPSS